MGSDPLDERGARRCRRTAAAAGWLAAIAVLLLAAAVIDPLRRVMSGYFATSPTRFSCYAALGMLSTLGSAGVCIGIVAAADARLAVRSGRFPPPGAVVVRRNLPGTAAGSAAGVLLVTAVLMIMCGLALIAMSIYAVMLLTSRTGTM